MKRLLLVMTIVLILSAFASAAPRVYIERVNGGDATLVNLAQPALAGALQTKGFDLTTDSAQADFALRFSIVSADVDRHFNLAILFCPLWPFVPFATPEANVVLTVQVLDTTGKDVFSNSVGDEEKAWLFGDFISGDKLKREAFEDAMQTLLVNFNG